MHPSVPARMNPKEPLIPKQTPDCHGYSDASVPPPYSYQEQQPPAYSADESAHRSEVVAAGYASFQDIIPEATSETTPMLSSWSFEDKTVRRAFVRKVCLLLLSVIKSYRWRVFLNMETKNLGQQDLFTEKLQLPGLRCFFNICICLSWSKPPPEHDTTSSVLHS